MVGREDGCLKLEAEMDERQKLQSDLTRFSPGRVKKCGNFNQLMPELHARLNSRPGPVIIVKLWNQEIKPALFKSGESASHNE